MCDSLADCLPAHSRFLSLTFKLKDVVTQKLRPIVAAQTRRCPLLPLLSRLARQTGQVVATCFTNNIGRVVDFCEGVVLDDSVWLISSPHRWQKLLGTMDKFIFPMDK